MALVTVLMSVRNGERYLGEAVSSILAQTHSDFEFVVVENASTDRTWDFLNSFRDPRLRLFRTGLGQLPFNLNFGLEQSRGAYVARMDADDVAEPERLERQVARFESDPGLGVLGTAYVEFGDGIAARTRTLPLTDAAIRRGMPFRSVIAHPTVMMRRDVVMGQRGYEHVRGCEDLDLWLRIARDGRSTFANLETPLLRYRLHGDQSKGSREAYYNAASVLLKEGLVARRTALVAGAVACIAKGLVRGR